MLALVLPQAVEQRLLLPVHQAHVPFHQLPGQGGGKRIHLCTIAVGRVVCGARGVVAPERGACGRVSVRGASELPPERHPQLLLQWGHAPTAMSF